MGPGEAAELVLARNRVGVAQILDELEPAPEREDFGALDILDIVGEALVFAELVHRPLAEFQLVAEGIFGRHILGDDLAAHGLDALIDLVLAFAHLPLDVEALGHFFLLGDLEAHYEFARVRHAIDREARGIGPAMLERLEHRGEFPADVSGSAPMDQSGNPTHCCSSPSVIVRLDSRARAERRGRSRHPIR